MNNFEKELILDNFFKKSENPNYVIYEISLDENNSKELIDYVIGSMNVGDELSVTYLPFEGLAVGDCTREIRKLDEAKLQAKQGMHGSRGTWFDVTFDDAVAWIGVAIKRNFDLLGTHQRCVYQLKRKVTTVPSNCPNN